MSTNDESTETEEVECENCHQKGHLFDTCPERKQVLMEFLKAVLQRIEKPK